jgi:hypothetical protein
MMMDAKAASLDLRSILDDDDGKRYSAADVWLV